MKDPSGYVGILCVFLFVQACIAEQKTFTQVVGNNAWEIAANWNPPGVPSNNDDVIIPEASQGYAVTISSDVQCNSFTLGGTSTNNQQQLQVTSGTFSIYGNGTVSASGQLMFSGASATGLSSSGTFIFVDGAITFTTGGAKIMSSLTIQIRPGGNMLVTGQNNGLIMASAASVIVENGGNLTLSSQGGIYTGDSTPVSLVNMGYFLCIPSTLDNFRTTIGITILNLGTVSVQSGYVEIQSNGTWSGILEIISANVTISTGNHQFTSTSAMAGNGTLLVENSAWVQLQGRVSVATFILNGGSARVNVDETTASFQYLQLINGLLSGSTAKVINLLWEGGTIVMDHLNVATLQVVGSIARAMTNTSLVVSGQATFQSSTNLLLTSSTFIVVGEMTFDKQLFFLCANDTSSVQIVGELLVTYAGETTLTCPLGIQPGGRVNVEEGTLILQNPVTSDGSLNISASSTVILQDQNSFFSDSSLFGDGTLVCQSCVAQILGLVSLGNLEFPGGTITFQLVLPSGTGFPSPSYYLPFIRSFNQSSGSSALVLINNSPADLNLTIVNFYFGGGTISSNQNAKLQLQANLIVTNSSIFYGSSPFTLTNVAFINNGTTTFTGSGSINLVQNTIIYNSPTGTFQVEVPMTATQSSQTGFMSEIRNYGTLLFSTLGTSTLGLNVNNVGNGTLVVAEGGIAHVTIGFFTQYDSAVSVVHGILQLENAGLVLGGTLQGTGEISGAITLNGGSILINDDSSLTITQQLLQLGNGMLVVDVCSSGILHIQVQYMLEGGSLSLFASNPLVAPIRKQFVAFPSQVGSGFFAIPTATFNSTYGIAYSFDETGFYSDVTPLPKISAITPTSGSTAGGEVVTLTGGNLYGAYYLAQVLFQGVPVTTTYNNPTSVSFQVPTGTGKGLSVTYVIDGRASMNELQWYYSPPVIQSIVPQTGPTLGANMVTLTGSNFGEDATVVYVSFGTANEICAISQISENQIVCAAPAGLGLNVSVTVNVNQQSSSSSLLYGYYTPILESVYPSALFIGDQVSSKTITITGQNLAYRFPDTTSNVTILIGNNECTNVVQTSLSTYTCALPATLGTISNVGDYPIIVEVQSQASNNLTFKVVNPGSNNHNTPKASKFAWPWPWWYFASMAGALVLFFVIGLIIGIAAKRGSAAAPTYERIN